MNVARICGIMVQAVLGRAADCDARILLAVAKFTLRRAWLAWAPADQPCERRRDVAIEILSEKAVAVGAMPDHSILKIEDACGCDLEQARE